MLKIYTNSVFHRHDTGVGHPENARRLDAAMKRRRARRARTIASSATPSSIPTPAASSPKFTRANTSASSKKRAAPAIASSTRSTTRSRRRRSPPHAPLSPLHSQRPTACGAARSRAARSSWRGRPDITPNAPRRWGSASSTRSRAWRSGCANSRASSASSSSTSTCITETGRSISSKSATTSTTRRCIAIRSIRAPARLNEIGIGKGRGFTKNIPFDGGTGDATYLRAVEDEIVRIIDDYRPNAILLSSGFDAHRRDPLGGMKVTEQAYGEITRRIVETAERHCHGRVLSLLEGGYDMEGLAASVAEHVAAMT